MLAMSTACSNFPGVGKVDIFLFLGDSILLFRKNCAGAIIGNLLDFTSAVTFLLVLNPAGHLGQWKIGEVKSFLIGWLKPGHGVIDVIASPLGRFFVWCGRHDGPSCQVLAIKK